MFEKVLLALSAVFVATAVGGYYYLENESGWVRAAILFVGLVAAVIAFFLSDKGKNLWVFLQEARSEVRMVVWPTSKETMQMTMVVFVVVVAVGLMLWVFDFFLLASVEYLTGAG